MLLDHLRFLFAQHSRGLGQTQATPPPLRVTMPRRMNSVALRPTDLPQDLKVRSIEALLTRGAFVAVGGRHAAFGQASHTWH